MTKKKEGAEHLQRELASDVPKGAVMRKDGSYTVAVEDLTDEEKELLVHSDKPFPDAELASMDNPPRETGTEVHS